MSAADYVNEALFEAQSAVDAAESAQIRFDNNNFSAAKEDLEIVVRRSEMAAAKARWAIQQIA